jgi:hypothetical protein
MDFHANAALSLNKRRLLCRRVVVEQWTVTKAAAAAEVSVRCARKWIARYRAEGELGLLEGHSMIRNVWGGSRTPSILSTWVVRARYLPPRRSTTLVTSAT